MLTVLNDSKCYFLGDGGASGRGATWQPEGCRLEPRPT